MHPQHTNGNFINYINNHSPLNDRRLAVYDSKIILLRVKTMLLLLFQ